MFHPSHAATRNVFAEAQTLAKSQATAFAANKNSTLHHDETSKNASKTGSIQVTAGGRSFAVGLFHKDIDTAERLFDSVTNWLQKTAGDLTWVKENGIAMQNADKS